MPKKDEGLASYRAWLSENKKLEKMGLYGTDHYIKRVKQLEAKVKRLEKKIKSNTIKPRSRMEGIR